MADAMTIAARLKEGIDEPLPPDSPAHAVGSFAVSIGVATSNGVKDVDEVLAQADEALYRAKALGRGRVIATATA
jgi:diguanylate cyclase (GGDEF)-like protein